MRVLVTGASGFVGRATISALSELSDYEVFGAVRNKENEPVAGVEYIEIGDIGIDTDWTLRLRNVDVIIHAAARVHVMNDTAVNPLALYRQVNVDGSESLARQAAVAGVSRFIFISTVKVNGDVTANGRPFRNGDTEKPNDYYAKSKLEAESKIKEVAESSELELVVVRPPLVYGPRVGGNFRSLLQWIDRGWPVPLPNVPNKRSLVALDNLVELLRVCTSHPAASGKTFFVSDDDDMSTRMLLERIGIAMNRKVRILPLPWSVLRAAAGLSGRGAQFDRLMNSLQVDVEYTKNTLKWAPVVDVGKALADTVRDYTGPTAK